MDNIKRLYSNKVRNQIINSLKYAEQQNRVNVYEWNNFIDYDIIPLIRKVVEDGNKILRKVQTDD